MFDDVVTWRPIAAHRCGYYNRTVKHRVREAAGTADLTTGEEVAAA